MTNECRPSLIGSINLAAPSKAAGFAPEAQVQETMPFGPLHALPYAEEDTSVVVGVVPNLATELHAFPYVEGNTGVVVGEVPKLAQKNPAENATGPKVGPPQNLVPKVGTPEILKQNVLGPCLIDSMNLTVPGKDAGFAPEAQVQET